MDTNRFDAAASFLASSARILDRRRFDRLLGGPAGPVRDAIAAYVNADGGFGNALEPDCRAPGSQPGTIEVALRMLHDADAWDESLVAGACGWLESHAPDGGGAIFVDPSVEGWPHAPWWQPQPGLPASLVAAGQIAGTLHARGVVHPWLTEATAWLWSTIEGLTSAFGYEMRGVIRFLNYVPEPERAEAALHGMGKLILDLGLVALDPEGPGEDATPLDYAPYPADRARRLFDDSVIEAHLDHLAAGQQEDGGWTFPWPEWSAAATADWRGAVTVDALRILKANGR